VAVSGGCYEPEESFTADAIVRAMSTLRYGLEKSLPRHAVAYIWASSVYSVIGLRVPLRRHYSVRFVPSPMASSIYAEVLLHAPFS
jgi:hypothetical protein